MMQNPKIPTTIMLGEEVIADAMLLVVPDRGERISIEDKQYSVVERRFHLKQLYNGGQPYGFSESCILIVKVFKPLTLNC
jgi:hypothetical protein